MQCDYICIFIINKFLCVDAAFVHYNDANFQSLRSNVTWKLAKLNKGEATVSDLIDWTGFDKEKFDSLKGK